MKLATRIAFALLISLTLGAFAAAQTASVMTTGLLHPNKVILAPNNSLLIAEDGTATPNTGRISVVDRTSGDRHTLISGFPSAPNPLGENQPDGVTGLHLQGNILWVTIGNGDAVLPGAGPGLEVPNPAPSSDLFASILEIRLPGGYTEWSSPIVLTADDREELSADGLITVSNGSGGTVTIRVVANLPDHVPAPTQTSPENVKGSHLYGVEKFQTDLYVVDSGLNRIHRVGIQSGTAATHAVFPNKPNPLFPGLGGPFVEAVPDNIRRFGNRLLVPLLTGFPFVPGLAEIRAVDIKSGEHVGLIPNLSAAIDIIKAGDDDDDPDFSQFAPGDGNAFFTLEFSVNMLGGAPGRLRYYSSPTADPENLVTNLITPTSIARDGESGDLFITNIGPGTLTRVTWSMPASLIKTEKRSK